MAYEVYEKEWFIELDGPCGGEWIPESVCGPIDVTGLERKSHGTFLCDTCGSHDLDGLNLLHRPDTTGTECPFVHPHSNLGCAGKVIGFGYRYDGPSPEIPEALRDYCENHEAWTIRRVYGYGVANYECDPVSYSVFTNLREAKRYRREMNADY